MVDLEIKSTFSFQNKWLGDVNPSKLRPGQAEALAVAKQKAQQREELEKRIPKHMLYTKGWPHSVPSFEDAKLLAVTRREVGRLLNVEVKYTTAKSVIKRYKKLLALKETKRRAKAKKGQK